MNIKTLNRLWVLITTACILFSLCLPAYSNWSPVAYFVICLPYLVIKAASTAYNASNYIQRYHPEFHKKYRQSSFTGNVRLELIPDEVLQKLNDDKIVAYKKEMRGYSKLFMGCFMVFGLLGIYAVLLA